MIAKTHSTQKTPEIHGSKGWRRFSCIAVCLIAMVWIFGVYEIAAYARPQGCTDDEHFEYATYDDNSHTVNCPMCNESWTEPHVYHGNWDTDCNRCGYERAAYTENPTGGMPDVELDGNDQGDFAWNIYKLMCSIAMPLAIISFASCGFRFLGSIFLGTYSAPTGNDIQKAQKQFLYTLLFVLLIILMPLIFGEAMEFFQKSAWTP